MEKTAFRISQGKGKGCQGPPVAKRCPHPEKGKEIFPKEIESQGTAAPLAVQQLEQASGIKLLKERSEPPNTPEELEALVKNHPREALQYANRLTDEQFGSCADKFLYFAMTYDADRLTPAQIQTAYRVYPTGALQFAAHRLTAEELLTVVETHLDLVRIHLRSTTPPPRLLPALIQVSDRLDQKTRNLLKRAIAKQI